MATLTRQDRLKRRETIANEVKRGFKVETVIKRHGVTLKTVPDPRAEHGVDFPKAKRK